MTLSDWLTDMVRSPPTSSSELRLQALSELPDSTKLNFSRDNPRVPINRIRIMPHETLNRLMEHFGHLIGMEVDNYYVERNEFF